MRTVLLILIALALGCARAGDRQIASQSTVEPGIVRSSVSSTPSASLASIPVTDSSALGSESGATPGLKPIVRLVDFAVHGGDGSDTVARVEVTLGTAIDTIPGVVTALTPVATEDGMVHGIAMTGEGFVKGGYDYDARTRKLTVVTLPPDVNEYNYDIKINDDAKFVAYIVIAEKTWAVVRSWPGMTEVVKSLPSDGYPSDYSVENKVGWSGLYQFWFQYRISTGPYLIVDGDAQRRTIKVDTLASPY